MRASEVHCDFTVYRKVSVDTLETINDEIDKAPYTTSVPETILAAQAQGSCSDQTASMALGFNDDEYLKAREDNLARIMRIAQAQQKGAGAGAAAQDADGAALDNPAARGVKDMAVDPKAAADEKAISQDACSSNRTVRRLFEGRANNYGKYVW